MKSQTEIEWKKTFDTIHDAITIHDTDYNIVSANKAAEDLLAQPLRTILNQKCFQYYHGTTGPPDICPSCETLKTGNPTTTEIYEPNLKKHIEIRTLPRFDKKMKVIGVVHIVRDFSKQREVEQKVEDRNAVMRVLLEEQGKERKDLEKSIDANVKEQILPYVKMLKGKDLDDEGRSYLDIIEKNLKEIISPFSHHLLEHVGLTPREVRVASLVQKGYRDKDIAETLRVSVDTVRSHRKNMRMKLGIKNKKIRLKTHLNSLKEGE